MTNRTLPPLPVWAARSTLAALLAMAVAVAQIFGLDLYGFLGVGEERVLDALEGLTLFLSLVWFWWERRAPHRRLVAYKP